MCGRLGKILYAAELCPGQLQSRSSAGDLGPVAGVGGFRVDKLGKFAHSRNKGMLHVNDNDVDSSANVCSSAHTYGCVIDGSVARTVY